MIYYQGLKMSEKNLNFSPATPPMDLSDTNSNNSNDFKVSSKPIFSESSNFQTDVIQKVIQSFLKSNLMSLVTYDQNKRLISTLKKTIK